MKEDPNIHTIDKEAIPLHVWESLAAETARYIRELLRDPDIRAGIAPEMDKNEKA